MLCMLRKWNTQQLSCLSKVPPKFAHCTQSLTHQETEQFPFRKKKTSNHQVWNPSFNCTGAALKPTLNVMQQQNNHSPKCLWDDQSQSFFSSQTVFWTMFSATSEYLTMLNPGPKTQMCHVSHFPIGWDGDTSKTMKCLRGDHQEKVTVFLYKPQFL